MHASLGTERATIGRDDAWRCVVSTVEQAEAGAAAVLLVQGGPGIGKSLLLRDAAAWAGARGLPVATHRADFGHGGVTAVDEPADGTPHFVAVDDVQSLSSSAERALRRAIRRSGEAVVWMLAARPGRTAERLLRECPGIVTRTMLRPLTEPQATALAAKLLGFQMLPGQVARQVAEADGDPQLITELVQGLTEEIPAPGAASGGLATRDSLPARVRIAVEQRLARLSPRSRQAVCRAAVAVSAPGADAPSSRTSLKRHESTVLAPFLEEAVAAGLLRTYDDGRVAFTSPLLRSEVARSVRLSPSGSRSEGPGPAQEPAAQAAPGPCAAPERAPDPAARVEELWRAGNAVDSLRIGRRVVSEDVGLHGTSTAAATVSGKLAAMGSADEAWQMLDRAPEEPLSESGRSCETTLARARLLLRAGRIGEARRAAQRVTRFDDTAGAAAYRPMGQALAALVALRCGDLSEAVDHMDHCLVSLQGSDAPLDSPMYGWVRAQLVAARHGARPAIRLLSATDGEPGAHLWREPSLYLEEPGAAAWLVRLAQSVDDPELAEDVVDRTAEIVDLNGGLPETAAVHEHARGLVLGDLDALRVAAAGHCDAWARGCALEDLAVVSLRTKALGQHEWTRTLESAFEEFRACGADRDAARVRQRLRTVGRYTPSQRFRRENGTGWETLSEVERTIAHLAGSGLTNRQIAQRVYLSPHTVNYHLRKIYPRLGVGSRVELSSAMQTARA
ncbi:LuxR C-terminal-related transcriptional regulator [Streptomyces sp. NPDC005374]|uniref:LuxR C-terminal-related transcriptional regulator n=1 Tax=Streptomyces sp. NPDC005374 TaxID=3364713 RepID=UPI0036A88699